MTSMQSCRTANSLLLLLLLTLFGAVQVPAAGLDGAHGAYLQRPLDPRKRNGRSIAIYYEWYRHTALGPARGTLVATEGGPGYPATLSRKDYLALFAPLRAHRDVLLMDNRGTGKSAAVNCRGLQRASKPTTALIGDCGRALGADAYLYSTALAAGDLADILDARKIATIDLYGDSYGTYFEQVFAVLHPDKLRSIVLDGAYPLNAPEYAWYPSYAPAMRDKFNLSCRRSAHCAQYPGDSIAHIQPALEMLRRRPFQARAFNADGIPIDFSADASVLATVMFGAAPPYATLRETDAAARAFSAGDAAPLLRLMADSITNTDSRDPSEDPAQWSSGLAVAVMCGDLPQIVDMQSSVEQRRTQFKTALDDRRRMHAQMYAPFTIDEYRGLPLDYAFIEQCLEWPPPVQTPPHPPGEVVPPQAPYPAVPALVISGEYDNMTTVADGAAVAAAFPRGRQVIIANSFHVNALPRSRSDCAARIVRRFLSTLEAGDTSCAASVPAVRLAPDFINSVALIDPATALPGNTASVADRRCAAAAVRTAGDVVTRLHSNTTGHGMGLRGGSFRVTTTKDAEYIHVLLDQIRWTHDLRVSGELVWGGQRGSVAAHLTYDSQGGCASADLRARWPQVAANARARITGTIGSSLVLAELEAP